MINRWQGNSGRRQRLPEAGDRCRVRPETARPEHGHAQQREPQRKPGPAPGKHGKKPDGVLSGLESLTKLIPGKAEELETEDIILLLILYLMYRESGDSELLMIMGAMFLL